MSTNSLNDSKSKAAEARQEAVAAESRTKQLGAFTDFASIKEQRLASVMARRADALRLGALHARALARDPEGQLDQTPPRLR